ncbi:ABC transporter permease [Cohnella hongkongensis]|uniref:ABC transporter permease n=1 Tax=Cohnella hongkongensis TaxID=178337 RepID=A0ABV9FBP2_9BACL
MNPIFMSQWMKEKRSPITVLAFFGLSIIATLLFGQGSQGKMTIAAFPAQGLEASVADEWLDRLNDNESIAFVLEDEAHARSEVREGRADAAIQLRESDYRLIATVENPNVQLVERHVHTVFTEELRLRAAANYAENADGFRDDVDRYLEQPPVHVRLTSADGGDLVNYDMSLQLLFTFTLFLSFFTIGFKVNAITQEKVSGIWNRVILSPMRKSEMYLGHLTYSSIIGFAQIAAVLLLFRYAIGFGLGDRIGMLLLVAALYTLTAVAFSMLITGMVRTPEQFNMVFPSLIPIMPLISGGYMPPGTITNPFLLAIAEAFPLTHALDAMIGISVYDESWSDIYLPLAKLALIGVVCMGVGINLVERRRG